MVVVDVLVVVVDVVSTSVIVCSGKVVIMVVDVVSIEVKVSVVEMVLVSVSVLVTTVVDVVGLGVMVTVRADVTTMVGVIVFVTVCWLVRTDLTDLLPYCVVHDDCGLASVVPARKETRMSADVGHMSDEGQLSGTSVGDGNGRENG